MHDDLNLMSGERVLWSGEPQRHPVFENADLAAVPLSLLSLGFVVAWALTAIHAGAPFLMQLFAIPLGLYALYLVFGRFIVQSMRLRSTRYVVTDRRVVEIGRMPRRWRRELYLRDLSPPIAKVKDGDSVGSVAFGSFPSMAESLAAMGFQMNRRKAPLPLVLREIEQAGYVRDIIASAQAAKR